MAGYIGKNVQVASTSSTAEGRDLMEAQSVAEQRALLDVASKAEVDAKVETSAIGTAAASDVTTSSTDTTAGRLLKVGDFGVGGIVVNTDGNFNNYLTTGSFYVSASTVINAPSVLSSFYGTIEVVNGGGSVGDGLTQKLINNDGGRVYYRTYWANISAWQPWQEIYHTGNILGTVSQSGSVPTGAIIESGFNSNGYYTKYADGTLICHVNQYAHYTNVADMGFIWSFPVQFTVNPTMSVTSSLSYNQGIRTFAPITRYNELTTTSAGVYVNNPINTNNQPGDTLIVSVMASGRWY